MTACRVAFIITWLGLVGCSSTLPPTPRPAVEAARKDFRTALVIADEESREISASQSGPGESVYQRARQLLGQKTQGLLRVVGYTETLEIIAAAGVRPQTTGPAGTTCIRINRSQIPRVAAVAAAQGIDYVIIVLDWETRTTPYIYEKDDRLKLVGAIGLDNHSVTNGYVTDRELDLSIWHSKSGRELIRQRFKSSDGGGARENADIDEWLGLAVVQRLMPESTQTERNPSHGDYTMNMRVYSKLSFQRHNPPLSGVLGHSGMVPLFRVARTGEEVRLTAMFENFFDSPLRLRLSGAFCLDRNGSRYDDISAMDRLYTLASEQQEEVVWTFRVPDRNIDFLNLFVKVDGNAAPDFYAHEDLEWKNIQIYPLSTAPENQPHAKPSRGSTITDGSAWHMRDLDGKAYTAKTCLGNPVIVFYCDDRILQNTGILSEGSIVGLAAAKVGQLFRETRDRGFQFLWIDPAAGFNRPGLEKAERKFGLTMPIVVPDEDYKWHLATSGQPWLTIIDTDGKTLKSFRSATAIMDIDPAVFLTMHVRQAPQTDMPANFGDDPILTTADAGASITSFQVITKTFTQNYDEVWKAVQAQARKSGIWRVGGNNEWIQTKSYIYTGYWKLFSDSKVCRHVISVQTFDGRVVVQVVTPLWLDRVRVDESGRMGTTISEYPNYDNPTSISLSRKFLDGVVRRLR